MSVAAPSPQATIYQKPVAKPRARKANVSLLWAVFCLLHIPLGMMMDRSEGLATLHAFATFAVGLFIALRGKRSIWQVACAGAYITGAEVMWRMTTFQVFWEFGKYATIAIFLVAMARNRKLKVPRMPLFYFLLLLPSSLMVMANVSYSRSQTILSAFLSGPLAVFVCAWFFSQIELDQQRLQRLFLSAVGPLLGVAAIAIAGIQSASDIRFSNNSNFATSGGFGPNQVSSMLGLGALMAMLFLIAGKTGLKIKIAVLGFLVLLAAQSALTFSRSGIYNAGAALILAVMFLLKDGRSRINVIILAAVLFVVGNYIVFPKLDDFTGGALSDRFSNLSRTHRDEIALAEIEVWLDNPILGVGPGQAKSLAGGNHTEFTRLLAEHGTLGLAALLILLFAGVKNLLRARTPKGKAIAAAFVGWSFMFMLNTAMRLVAPAFTMGLSFAALLPEQSAEDSKPGRSPVKRPFPHPVRPGDPSLRSRTTSIGRQNAAPR
jgi:hypothetical protein